MNLRPTLPFFSSFRRPPLSTTMTANNNNNNNCFSRSRKRSALFLLSNCSTTTSSSSSLSLSCLGSFSSISSRSRTTDFLPRQFSSTSFVQGSVFHTHHHHHHQQQQLSSFSHQRRGVATEQQQQQQQSSNIRSPGKLGLPNQIGQRQDSPTDVDTDDHVPGDSFGIFEPRMPFIAPAPRQSHPPGSIWKQLFPPGTPPEKHVQIELVQKLSAQLGISESEIVHVLVDVASMDINVALHELATTVPKVRDTGGLAPFSFGLVALEVYEPETFALVSFRARDFATTRRPEVLEMIHELTLSAAELPVDTPSAQLVSRFVETWTTEDDTPVRDILKKHDLIVKDIILLPMGEYSCNGYYVQCPLTEEGFPNIGTLASCTCLDLRTGIHNRFRFHAERIADSVSEHICKEFLHFAEEDNLHILRQPFWFNPEYSVEDFLRLKEALMQPSLLIFEMRNAFAAHLGKKAYRNIVEMEALKTQQYKTEMMWKDHPRPGDSLAEGGNLVTLSTAAGGPQSGTSLFRNKPESVGKDEGGQGASGDKEMYDRTRGMSVEGLRDCFNRTDKVWRRFYKNNYY